MVRLAMMLLRGSTRSPVVWKQVMRKSHRQQLASSLLFSTSSTKEEKPPPLVLTQLNHPAKGVATITMNNMRVNSLSLEMCTALSQAVKQVEDSDDSTVQSLILKSSKPSIFSAGLDILEMHQPNVERLHHFWHAFQQLYLDLYGSRLACIAAIQGNAPAAGCMLALSCDYRIMAATPSPTTDLETKAPPSSTIGLNETKLGIAAPPWLARQFHDTIGRRQAELGLSLGLLYTPEQALDIGLVDELVPTKDEVLTRAEQVALEWGRIPPQARVASKMLMRQDAIDNLVATRQADTDHFVCFITHPKVQQNLTAYLEMLATKKKK